MNVLEGALLLRAAGRPEGPESRLAVLDRGHAEQVLQAVLEERVALHVEEQVAVRRRRQPGESAAVLGWEQLVAQLAGGALLDLKTRLLAKRLEGVHADPHRALGQLRARKVGNRADACLDESRRLRAAHVRDQAQVIVRLATGVAVALPAAQPAVLHRVGIGAVEPGFERAVELPLDAAVVRRELGEPEALARLSAKHDVHPVRRASLDAARAAPSRSRAGAGSRASPDARASCPRPRSSRPPGRTGRSTRSRKSE